MIRTSPASSSKIFLGSVPIHSCGPPGREIWNRLRNLGDQSVFHGDFGEPFALVGRRADDAKFTVVFVLRAESRSLFINQRRANRSLQFFFRFVVCAHHGASVARWILV